MMNMPNKAVSAAVPVQNADKSAESNKPADQKEAKVENPEKKVEMTNPAPTAVK